MKISILTLFPEYFEPLWNTSIIKRAKEKDLFEYEVIDFRNLHRKSMAMLMIHLMVGVPAWF